MMSTWDALKDIAKHANVTFTITEPRSGPDFPQEQRKITMLGKPDYVFIVLRHGRSCQEMCGTTLRAGEENYLYKVLTPCIDDHQFKEEELKSVGELSDVCSQIVLKCVYLAQLARPDVLWSVKKLARAITKSTDVRARNGAELVTNFQHV